MRKNNNRNNKNSLKKLIGNTLAMILFSGCFPQAGEAEEIINLNNSHECTVRGYATEIDKVYEVDIYWTGNMTFVFDRGVHNSTTGELDCTFPSPDTTTSGTYNPDVITNTSVEKSKNPGDVNSWYGFDGIRNQIIVLNRSNAAIKASYAVSKNTSNNEVEKVSLTLYDHENNINNEEKNLLFNIDQDQTSENYGKPTNRYDTDDLQQRFGNNSPISSTDPDIQCSGESKIIPGSPLTGSLYGNKVFLNISGTPGENFPTEISDSEDKCNIGTITITLNQNLN